MSEDKSEVLHNCKIKRFPDGSADILVCSRPFGGGRISREPDRGPEPSRDELLMQLVEWDVRAELQAQRAERAYAWQEQLAKESECDEEPRRGTPQYERARRNADRARRRARTAVRDLGKCNGWRFFVTLTLSPDKINRYDPAVVVHHLNHWLDNAVRRHGLAYVLVPEHHKDGAIHFHGFFNDALKAVDSGHRDKGGHVVYNLPQWGWGYSTAIELYGEREAAVAYTCKYVSKQEEKIGGRWYYSGGRLQRPAVEWCDTDFEAAAAAADAEPFEVDALPWSRFVVLHAAAQNVEKSTHGF